MKDNMTNRRQLYQQKITWPKEDDMTDARQSDWWKRIWLIEYNLDWWKTSWLTEDNLTNGRWPDHQKMSWPTEDNLTDGRRPDRQKKTWLTEEDLTDSRLTNWQMITWTTEEEQNDRRLLEQQKMIFRQKMIWQTEDMKTKQISLRIQTRFSLQYGLELLKKIVPSIWYGYLKS